LGRYKLYGDTHNKPIRREMQGEKVLTALRELVTQEGAWQQDARCAETDPEAFFPDLYSQSKFARQVCAECPVRRECYDYAIEIKADYGVWGGVDFTVRRNADGTKVRRVNNVKLS
jgi:WhiB family transcriptional regulator, redox-sensing transcriptional regulator